MARSRTHRQSRPARTAWDLPTLSVVLPAYKVAPYLERCLDSLLHQAPPELIEIIVVDDGSPDDSGAIAERRAAADPRLRVIHQANAGTAAARNAGMDATTGDYVGFVDPDDMVDPGWALSLLQVAARQRPAIVRGEWREVTFDGRPPPPHPTCMQALSPTPLTWYGPLWCAIYRRDFIVAGEVRHPVGRVYSQDLDFVVHAVVAALLAGERIVPCPQACYAYLRRPDGADSSMLSHDKVSSVLGIISGLHELLMTQAPRLPQAGVAVLYYQWIRNLGGYYHAKTGNHADAAAVVELIRRLAAECPAPAELQQQHLAQGGGPWPPLPRPRFAPVPAGVGAASPPEDPAGRLRPEAAGTDQTAGRRADSPAAGSAPDARSGVSASEAAGAQDPRAALLRRARQLLGEDDGGEGDVAELVRLLRRLYRAQNRLDSAQLGQLGQDCLQALAADECMPRLQAAATALAQLHRTLPAAAAASAVCAPSSSAGGGRHFRI